MNEILFILFSYFSRFFSIANHLKVVLIFSLLFIEVHTQFLSTSILMPLLWQLDLCFQKLILIIKIDWNIQNSSPRLVFLLIFALAVTNVFVGWGKYEMRGCHYDFFFLFVFAGALVTVFAGKEGDLKGTMLHILILVQHYISFSQTWMHMTVRMKIRLVC